MVRIVRDPNKKGIGAPRGQATNVTSRVSLGGGRVPKDKVSRSGITRLIARDPAKGVSANIGTKLDNISGLRVGGQASLTTAMAGANNDMVFKSKFAGAIGNSTRVRIVVAGANTPLSVSVSGADVTINSATDGGSLATSTANAVIAAVNASAQAMAVLAPVTLAAGETGAGVVAAFGFTNLTGGSDSVLEGTNTVDLPNPRIVDGSRYKRGATETHKGFGQDKSPNRSVRKLR